MNIIALSLGFGIYNLLLSSFILFSGKITPAFGFISFLAGATTGPTVPFFIQAVTTFIDGALQGALVALVYNTTTKILENL